MPNSSTSLASVKMWNLSLAFVKMRADLTITINSSTLLNFSLFFPLHITAAKCTTGLWVKWKCTHHCTGPSYSRHTNRLLSPTPQHNHHHQSTTITNYIQLVCCHRSAHRVAGCERLVGDAQTAAGCTRSVEYSPEMHRELWSCLIVNLRRFHTFFPCRIQGPWSLAAPHPTPQLVHLIAGHRRRCLFCFSQRFEFTPQFSETFFCSLYLFTKVKRESHKNLVPWPSAINTRNPATND